MRVALGFATVTLILTGCASTPEGQISYYFPKAITQLTVTQTLSCNEKLTNLHQVLTVTPTTAYISDTTKSYHINPSALGGRGADADLTLGFTDDGRLSSVNLVTAGQGGAILKDVLAVAKVALAVAAGTGGSYDAKEACKVVAEEGLKEKDGPAALTLKYAADFEYGPLAGSGALGIRDERSRVFTNEILLRVDPASETLYGRLGQHIPRLAFAVGIEGNVTPMEAPVWEKDPKDPTDPTALKLNRVGLVQIKLKGPVGNLENAGTVWNGQVAVPLTGDDKDFFFLPIPKAELFGKQTFALSLSPVGSIIKLQYASSGSTEASGAASALAGFVGEIEKEPTTTELAAKIQAEADLIYQQQRLALCIATPSACQGK